MSEMSSPLLAPPSNGIHSDRASTARCDDEIRIVLRVRLDVPRGSYCKARFALYAPTSLLSDYGFDALVFSANVFLRALIFFFTLPLLCSLISPLGFVNFFEIG